MSFFGVNNPFTTPVGQRIEQATDGSLPSENWALNIEICDIINETEDGPRDAIKAIKRRLTQAAGKNYTIVMYTLTVLETCVKNCEKRFHSLACSREFVGDLVKLIGPKNEPPTAVQEKVLSLIQTWADTFRHQPHTQGVVQVYQELKAKGIQFPMTDLDAMAPIITPERSVPEPPPTSAPVPVERPSSGAGDSSVVAPTQPTSQVSSPIRLQDQHIAKLRSEIEVVQGNMRVLAEMLQHVTEQCQSNQQPEQADLDLLHQLYTTCRAMQERVVELVGKLVDDEITAELLRINDELNNLFLRYSRFTKNKAIPPASALVAQVIGHPPSEITTKRSEPSLIDLDDGDSVAGIDKQIAELGIKGDDTRNKTKEHDKDEFDMFAQSRNATYETSKNSGSKYEDNMEELDSSISTALMNRGLSLASAASNSIDSDAGTIGTVARTVNPKRESEFSEMAAWLGDATAKEPAAAITGGDQESLTSSEFERFLAERAAAADALPNLPTVTTAPSTTTTGNTNIQRQINKDQDKSLFAL